MGPDNIFVKIFIALIFIAVIAHFALGYKNEQDRQVQATVDAVKSIASELTSDKGTNVDAITAAIAPLHEVSLNNILEGLKKTGPTKEEYVGAELVLLRVFELDINANIATHIQIEGKGAYWPWVFDGDDVRLDPFKIDSGKEIGSIADLLQMYKEQGKPRKPWNE